MVPENPFAMTTQGARVATGRYSLPAQIEPSDSNVMELDGGGLGSITSTLHTPGAEALKAFVGVVRELLKKTKAK